MRKFFQLLAILMLAGVISTGAIGSFYYKKLPDDFCVVSGNNLNFARDLPITISKSGDHVKTASVKAQPQSYKADIKLAGIIPIKTVNVKVIEKKQVILCGTPFGIKIFTDGVMVVGITEIHTENGARSPALDCGLLTGDIIQKVDGKRVYRTEDVAELIEKSLGEPLSLTVKREKECKTIQFSAALSDDGTYKAGMWIRDSSAGIGTLTYIDPDTSAFGGLGHGICDVDTGKIVPISKGEIVGVALTGVSKSSAGAPGELRGYLDTETIGNLFANNELGVYGTVARRGYSTTLYPVAMKQEVKEGKAKIITTIPGSAPALYDIEIDKVNYDEKSKSKNLVVKVTDARLINATGGIVQGMSGSPIIQNGKFIGAVTHVFVNDPLLGYGIFSENMLENSSDIKNMTKISAS